VEEVIESMRKAQKEAQAVLRQGSDLISKLTPKQRKVAGKVDPIGKQLWDVLT